MADPIKQPSITRCCRPTRLRRDKSDSRIAKSQYHSDDGGACSLQIGEPGGQSGKQVGLAALAVAAKLTLAQRRRIRG